MSGSTQSSLGRMQTCFDVVRASGQSHSLMRRTGRSKRSLGTGEQLLVSKLTVGLEQVLCFVGVVQ